MPVVDLQDTEFRGTSWRYTHQRGCREHLGCRHCGSSLHGRLEATRVTAGIRTLIFRCRCGRGRQIRRPAKGAAAG